MTKASLLFCLGRWPYVLTTPHLARTVTFVFTYTSLMPLVGLMWRFLLGFSGAFLLDCGAYEAPTLAFGAPHPPLVTWAALQAAAGLWFFFTNPGPHTPPRSWERLFRNAWWLEREVAEVFGLFIAKKRDRRSLFLVPLVYQAPLRRLYPVGGFFELGLAPGRRSLAWRHLTWAV